MALTRSDFVAIFPEFGDPIAYTDFQVGFWISQAYLNLNAARFGQSLDLAVALFTAHNLALTAQTAKSVASGGLPGASIAAISSKSVGSVSVSYDTSDASIDGAGEWNSTGYGQRLYRMLKSFNTGPFYAAHPRPLPRPGRYGYGRF